VHDVCWESYKEGTRTDIMREKERKATWLRGWVEEEYLVDMWRVHHEQQREYTHGFKKLHEELGEKGRCEGGEKGEAVQQEEQGAKRVRVEKRLDYIMVNRSQMGVATSAPSTYLPNPPPLPILSATLLFFPFLS